MGDEAWPDAVGIVASEQACWPAGLLGGCCDSQSRQKGKGPSVLPGNTAA
jgi:hypothetical protein